MITLPESLQTSLPEMTSLPIAKQSDITLQEFNEYKALVEDTIIAALLYFERKTGTEVLGFLVDFSGDETSACFTFGGPLDKGEDQESEDAGPVAVQ